MILRIPDTDCAGVLYHGALFRILNDCFEAFLESRGVSLRMIFLEKNYILPVVHVEADYSKPIRLGDQLTIQLQVGRPGNSSLFLEYSLLNSSSELAASARVVHVSVSKESGKAIALPDEIKVLVKAYNGENQSKKK